MLLGRRVDLMVESSRASAGLLFYTVRKERSLLGYLGNANWRDMSDYLVHLTGGKQDDGGRATFSNIIRSRCIAPTGIVDGMGVGTVRSVPWLSGTQYAACLSEIPLGWLDRLADRHGQFGVGFTKEYVRSVGGAPVWYLWKGSPTADVFQDLVRDAMRRQDPEEQLWKITPFVENPGRGDTYRYEFDWEREWRVRDGMAFDPMDVQFLFAPESEHDWVRHVLRDLYVGSKPVWDPSWDLADLQEKLAESGL